MSYNTKFIYIKKVIGVLLVENEVHLKKKKNLQKLEED